jgi:hypothetical protein
VKLPAKLSNVEAASIALQIIAFGLFVGAILVSIHSHETEFCCAVFMSLLGLLSLFAAVFTAAYVDLKADIAAYIVSVVLVTVFAFVILLVMICMNWLKNKNNNPQVPTC